MGGGAYNPASAGLARPLGSIPRPPTTIFRMLSRGHVSFNRLGHIFHYMTWGESHGSCIGCVVDGVPSGIPLCEERLQPWMDLRKPGRELTSQRKEADRVRILSGIFDGVTTGTPISVIIENTDHRSQDYSDIKDKFRPNHGDYAYYAKYGVRDYRGGGRTSARETACRVAVGAIARAVLEEIEPTVQIRGALVQVGNDAIRRENWDWDYVHNNLFFSPDSEAVLRWGDTLTALRKKGNSVGAIVELHASGVPAGIGAPLYAKLDQDISSAIMSINAVKGVEIGDGFQMSSCTGSDVADEMTVDKDGNVVFLSNHSGGILAGISTGQDIIARFSVKPTSSILVEKKSINTSGENIEVSTRGRHDPCIGIRAVPVGEAMMAIIILDHILLHRAVSLG